MIRERVTGISILSTFALVVVLGFSLETPSRATDLSDHGKWCNTYTSLMDPFQTGTFEPVKIEYGKAAAVNELDVVEAIWWYGDTVFRPMMARKTQVMHLYPVSVFDKKMLQELVDALSTSGSQEKPYFAMGASVSAMQTTGIKAELKDAGEFVLTPIWWNEGIAKMFQNTIDTPRGADEQLKLASTLAKIATYTVQQGIDYNSVPLNCNPRQEVTDAWYSASVPEQTWGDMYIAVSTGVADVVADKLLQHEVKALIRKDYWPTQD